MSARFDTVCMASDDKETYELVMLVATYGISHFSFRRRKWETETCLRPGRQCQNFILIYLIQFQATRLIKDIMQQKRK